jgi:hypothetical protein
VAVRYRPVPVIGESDDAPPPRQPKHSFRRSRPPRRMPTSKSHRRRASLCRNSYPRVAHPRAPTAAFRRPANRFVADEVLVEVRPDISVEMADAIAKQERLRPLASQRLPLIGNNVPLPDRRQATVIAALEAEPRIAAVQPNYLYTLQSEPTGGLAEAQYVVPKMRLTEAHAISNGTKTLVAVIDSGIDRNHPEISNAVKRVSTLTAQRRNLPCMARRLPES